MWNTMNDRPKGRSLRGATLSVLLGLTLWTAGIAQAEQILVDGFEDPNAPEPPVDPELVVSLYAQPAIISAGDLVTLFWDSENAASCTTSLGNATWQATSPGANLPGQVTLAVDEVPATFRITCQDAEGTMESRDANVIGTATPFESDCEGPEDVGAGIIESWNDVFVSDGFPDINQATDDHWIGRTNYFAIEFVTTDANVSGSITSVALSGGVRNISLSGCAGNFITDTPSQCHKLQGLGEVLKYTTNPAGTGCVLEKNTKYFLNVTYADVTDRVPEDSTCPSRECLVRLQVSSNVE